MSSLNPVQIISAIYGPEPHRDGEYPTTFQVGAAAFNAGPVTSIEERSQDLGSWGIQWFDVWCGDQRVASLNASHVAEIRYQDNRNT